MKILNLTALTLSIISTSSYAIVNGSSANWKENSNIAASSCTGLIVANKYILTAAHCNFRNNTNHFSSGEAINATSQITHPDYNKGVKEYSDFSFWVLPNLPRTETIDFLNPRTLKNGELISPKGFGGTNTELNQATMQLTPNTANEYPLVKLSSIGSGHTISGDSGGANYDSKGYVVALTSAGNGTDTYSAQLHGAADWIKTTINGWHFQTGVNVKSSATKTIRVQSLHTSANNLLNTIYTSGDANIDTAAITCESPEGTTSNSSTVEPFDICTIPITSNGGHGFIHLTSNEKIEVNKPAPSKKPVAQPTGGSSSGGSTGVLSLLVMGLFGLLRKKS